MSEGRVMRIIVVKMIRFYQLFVSPLTPSSCRFYPTCSHYAVEAVSKFGVIRGGWMSAKRISRCGPWHPGGYDPVP